MTNLKARNGVNRDSLGKEMKESILERAVTSNSSWPDKVSFLSNFIKKQCAKVAAKTVRISQLI